MCRHRAHRIRPVTGVLWLAALAVAGCGETADLAGRSSYSSGGSDSSGEKAGDKPKSGKSTRTDGKASAGDEKATKPARVSGAFLTCQTTDKVPDDKGKRQVGCRLQPKPNSSKKITFAEEDWFLADADKKRLDHDLKLAPDESAWNATTEIGEDVLPRRFVGLRYKYQGSLQGPFYTKIKVENEASKGGRQTLGKTEDFHIGDWDAPFLDETNPDCEEDELKPEESEGKGMVVPFEISGRESEVTIELNDMCGVTSGQIMGVELDFDNRVTLKGPDGVEVFSTTLESRVPTQTLETVTLPPGEYELVFASDKKTFPFFDEERDNFVIGEIIFESRGALTLGDLQPIR